MNNELLKTIQLGIETEAFLNTDLGKYLLSRAESELEDGIIKFLNTDTTNAVEITKIQSQCLRAANFKQWLNDAIIAGQQSEQELKENE